MPASRLQADVSETHYRFSHQAVCRRPRRKWAPTAAPVLPRSNP